MTPVEVPQRLLLALLAVLVLAWFSTLDYRRLIKPDEGRYAEIAREMAATGDWVTPRLNGIKYFEKPPLQYWMTAAAFEAFGRNEWTARLWTALTGFAGVLLAWFAGRRLFGPLAGALGALVLGSALWYVLMGHVNTLDMGVTFFLEAAMCAFLFAQLAPRRSRAERGWMLAAWGAMALAVLSKGLMGIVLPGAVLVAYCVLERTLEPLKRLHFGAGLLVFLLIGAPWFVAVSLANPEFPRFFFVHEHFERFLTQEHSRVQPWWYFVPILLAGLLPWTTFVLQACGSAWRRRSGEFNTLRFLLAWAGVIFLFFSASGSKLPSYILPVFPALALVTGDWLARCRAAQLRWHIAVVALAALAAALALPHLPSRADSAAEQAMLQAFERWLVVGLGTFVLAAAIAGWLSAAGRKLASLALLGSAGLVCAVGAFQGHEELGRSNSAHYIARQIMPHLSPGVPFYSVGMYEQTLPFYIDRTVTLVDYRDEFAFGLEQEPQRAIATLEDFRRRWGEEPKALAVMSRDGFALLQAHGLPMRVVAEDPRRVVVEKP